MAIKYLIPKVIIFIGSVIMLVSAFIPVTDGFTSFRFEKGPPVVTRIFASMILFSFLLNYLKVFVVAQWILIIVGMMGITFLIYGHRLNR